MTSRSHHTQELISKYSAYQAQGKLVLAVTLSTFMKSDRYAASSRTESFWNNHFMHRVKRYLPDDYREKFDFDYVLEKSPDGFWHYHGLLAIPAEASCKLWRDDELNPHFQNDLNSMRTTGLYRPFKINSYKIEPIRDGAIGITKWAQYMTKTSSYIRSEH